DSSVNSVSSVAEALFALEHVLPAVHFQYLAGHVATELLGREKHECTGALVGRAQPVHRDAGLKAFEHLRSRVAIMKRGRDDAGRHGVDTNPVLDQFLGKAMRDGADKTF